MFKAFLHEVIRVPGLFYLDVAALAAKPLQSCPTLCDPIDGSPPGSTIPGIFPGKNTGVGCHFLQPPSISSSHLLF